MGEGSSGIPPAPRTFPWGGTCKYPLLSGPKSGKGSAYAPLPSKSSPSPPFTSSFKVQQQGRKNRLWLICIVSEIFLFSDQSCWKSKLMRQLNALLFFFFFFFFFIFIPTAYGSSQARGPIGAPAASLHHSHINAGSEPLSATYTTAHSNGGFLTH